MARLKQKSARSNPRSQKNPRLVQFGGRIRKLREKRGWSQERFGEECDLHRTYIGGIERGERNVSFKNLDAIAVGLEIELSRLFEGLGQS